MQTKICSKCGIEKSIDLFAVRKDRPCGRMSACKACRAEGIRNKRNSKTITVERLKECFDYRVDGVIISKIKASNRNIGDIVGFVGKEGYLYTGVDGQIISVHRVVFALNKGYIPSLIDHLDGNPQNNRIENLEDSTPGRNSKNQKLRSTNKSGHMGVFWHKKEETWIASIYDKCVRIVLGKFKSKEDAVACRKKAEVEYGYSKNHGRVL